MTCIPVSWNCTSTAGRCSGLTTSLVLLRLGWSTYCGLVALNLSHISKGLRVLLPLWRHQLTMLGLHLLKLVDEGRVPMGYMTIANGSSCVVVHGTELLVLIAAYFEWNTLPVPLSPAAHAMLQMWLCLD